MLRKVVSVCTVFAVLMTVVHAQSVDEVQQRLPGENAVMLTSNRDVRFFLKDGEPVAETKVQTELLALTDKANGLYNRYKIFQSSFEEIKDIEAYTKVPDGSRYKKLKITDIVKQASPTNSIFYDDMKELAFDFPSLLKGAVGTVTHTEYLKDAHLVTPFYFTSYLPVVNAKCTVTFPEGMDVKYIIKNDDDKKVQVNEVKKGRQTVYEFTASYTKPKDRFGDGPPRSHFEPHVIFYVASYTNDKGSKVNYLSSVGDLYKWNYSFLKNVNTASSPALKHLADSLTQGATTDKEKAKHIYNWVQENIKYVAFENGLEGFIPRQAADVCNKRYGDCKDMASLLTELLKEAGLKAYFTWIGTRDIPYNYSEVPLPLTDNHMISTVKLGDDYVFLDGTDPNCIFGFPSEGIQGKQAMVSIDDNNYKLLIVPVLPADKNTMVDSTFISISDNGIKGMSSVYYNGYFGVDAYNSLLWRDTDDTRDYVKSHLSKGSNKFILDDYSVNKVSPADKVLNLKANFEVPDYSKKIADELYINLNLDLDKHNLTSIIDTAKRKVAVDNDFRFNLKNYTILELPKGFEVSYVPENYHFKNDLYTFNINYTVQGDKIIASREFKSDCIMLQPKDFTKWNETVKEVIKQSKKQLVLKKK